MDRYIEELIKYGSRSHSFSWCVSDGVCCAKRPGQQQRAHSVWPWPRRVRSAAASNITTSAAVAPSLIMRCGRWRRARRLFVCFFVERQLWGSTSFFAATPELMCRQHTTEMKFCLVQKIGVAWGGGVGWDGPVRRPLVQREYCDLVPGDPAQLRMQREVAFSPESCADGQQPIGVSINAEVSHSKLFECSLECSYVQKLPLEHPTTTTTTTPFLLTLSTEKSEVRMGWSHLCCHGISGSGESGRQLDNLVDMRPRWSQ